MDPLAQHWERPCIHHYHGYRRTDFRESVGSIRKLVELVTHFKIGVNPYGAPQLARRSLDAAGGLALLLHWMSSTMAGCSLQQIFSITPAVCARDLQYARETLLSVLKGLQISRISWPSTAAKCQQYSSLIETQFPLLTKCFGFIDGLNLPVNVAEDKE